MKKLSQKILAGSLVASFVIGVGLVGVLHNEAFADTAVGTSTSKAVSNGGHGGKGVNDKGRGGFRGGNVIKETATILGVEESVVQEALKADKTLEAFAIEKGLTKEDYLAKLVAAETTAITAEVTAGKLTQAQADKRIAALSDQLTKQIEGKGFGGGFPGGGQGGRPGDFGGKGGFGGPNNLIKETATILGVEESVVQEAIKADKTLEAFAIEKGLTKEDYLAKLVAAETTAITAEVTAGKLTQAQADERIAALSDQLTKQIEGKGFKGGFPGGGQGGKGGPGGFGGGFGNPEVITTILGITQDELRTELEAGKSIVDIATAKGISEDDLISKIKDGMTDSIKKSVEQKGTVHARPEGAQGHPDRKAGQGKAAPTATATN
jgi:primosomal protein N''